MATKADVRQAIAGERSELATLLGGLPPDLWGAPTLCAGWRPREVVAHMTMPFRLSRREFAAGMLAARGISTGWPTGMLAVTRQPCQRSNS